MADPKTENLPAASYVNVMKVAHTQNEFFFTFGQTLQETPGTAHLVATIAATPMVAKAMLKTLGQNVERYERRYGTIAIPPVVGETQGTA